MNEKINHPAHYQSDGRKECIEEIREQYGDYITCIFCLTNAYKYLYRAGEKEGNSAEQDIAKAKWYFDYVNNKIYKRCEVDEWSKNRDRCWSVAANELWQRVDEELDYYENYQTKL